jgi:putative transport protein
MLPGDSDPQANELANPEQFMDWLFELQRTSPTAHAIAILALVCVTGMSLGSIQVRGIKLGTAGVLFAAILTGHFGKPVDRHTLEFVKEFGLILFVFCIGLQIGPGFFASLRRAGLRLNGLAIAIVLLGGLSVAAIGWLLGFDGAAIPGIFSGATTNTPSLGAAQQTLASFPGVSEERAALPALAYAVTYPLGIFGIIATMLAIKAIYRIDVDQEVEAHAAAERSGFEPLERRTLVVENSNLQGVKIGDVPGLGESGVVVSRIRYAGSADVVTATRRTILNPGDHILVVGTSRGLDQFERVVGRSNSENLIEVAGPITYRRIVATNVATLGKSIQELDLEQTYGVVVTRVSRGDLEMTAVPGLRLKFGDVLQVVGPENVMGQVAEYVGDSVQALNETHFVPLFAGIFLGIALGMLPIAVPGLPQPLRLGLAGGPLIVAILLGRQGRIGRLVWHVPRTASMALRELGISLFFAGVGLMAGPTFFSTAFSWTGLLWVVAGAIVTVAPLLLIGMVARAKFAMNFVDLAGLLAGSMTDPPALAFANGLCHSEAPAVAYAAVYPLTMLLRIIVAQFLAVVLCG